MFVGLVLDGAGRLVLQKGGKEGGWGVRDDGLFGCLADEDCGLVCLRREYLEGFLDIHPEENGVVASTMSNIACQQLTPIR